MIDHQLEGGQLSFYASLVTTKSYISPQSAKWVFKKQQSKSMESENFGLNNHVSGNRQ